MGNDKARELAHAIVDQGRQRFNAMLGIVSRIQNGTYEIYAVASNTGIPEVGDVYPLDAVYCRDVFRSKQTVAITEIDGVPGMRLHPLYDTIPCEFYISSPIFVGGEVWGTVNYTSFEKRDVAFSPEEIASNEADALQISSAIS